MDDESGRSTTGEKGLRGENGPEAGLPRGRNFSLAQMLLNAGMLTAGQIAKAQETARLEKKPLGRLLVSDGLVLPPTWPPSRL